MGGGGKNQAKCTEWPYVIAPFSNCGAISRCGDLDCHGPVTVSEVSGAKRISCQPDVNTVLNVHRNHQAY